MFNIQLHVPTLSVIWFILFGIVFCIIMGYLKAHSFSNHTFGLFQGYTVGESYFTMLIVHLGSFGDFWKLSRETLKLSLTSQNVTFVSQIHWFITPKLTMICTQCRIANNASKRGNLKGHLTPFGCPYLNSGGWQHNIISQIRKCSIIQILEGITDFKQGNPEDVKCFYILPPSNNIYNTGRCIINRDIQETTHILR